MICSCIMYDASHYVCIYIHDLWRTTYHIRYAAPYSLYHVDCVSIPYYIKHHTSQGHGLMIARKLTANHDVTTFRLWWRGVLLSRALSAADPGRTTGTQTGQLHQRDEQTMRHSTTFQLNDSRHGTTQGLGSMCRGCSAAVCGIKKTPKAWHSLRGKRWTGLGPGWVMVLLVLVVVWFRTNDQER